MLSAEINQSDRKYFSIIDRLERMNPKILSHMNRYTFPQFFGVNRLIPKMMRYKSRESINAYNKR
jgi:hypothetical protein